MANLLLVYEPEAACRERLVLDGFDPNRALEISSYLAQSTDLALEFDDIEAACRERGIGFRPVELDELADALPSLDPATTVIWTLTDGIADAGLRALVGAGLRKALEEFGYDRLIQTVRGAGYRFSTRLE